MKLGYASFPDYVWNGLYPTNDDRLDDVDPNFFASDRITSEIISLEQYLVDRKELFELFKHLGAAGSVISVNNSQTGLIYREIVAGPGISIIATATQLIISSDVFFSTIVDENIVQGTPVYLKATGNLGIAASMEEKFRVAGLMFQDTLSGTTGVYITQGKLELLDWTQITGTVTLVPGSQYFLHPITEGKLTDTPPVAGFLVPVGQAQSTTELNIELQQTVRL